MLTKGQKGTLVLTRSEVAGVLDLEACIDSVGKAFRLHGEGRAPDPGVIGVHGPAGGFHVKAGVLDLARSYFVAKTNANYMNNRAEFGLPTIQGTIVLHDVANGVPLTVMDSIEISIQRTGAEADEADEQGGQGGQGGRIRRQRKADGPVWCPPGWVSGCGVVRQSRGVRCGVRLPARPTVLPSARLTVL